MCDRKSKEVKRFPTGRTIHNMVLTDSADKKGLGAHMVITQWDTKYSFEVISVGDQASIKSWVMPRHYSFMPTWLEFW